MGSPDFSLPALRALADVYKVVGVVTQPDRAAGRGRELKPPPVKLLAQELKIPVIQPEKLRQPEAMEQLRTLESRFDRRGGIWANSQERCFVFAAFRQSQRSCLVATALARRGADQCRDPAWR